MRAYSKTVFATAFMIGTFDAANPVGSQLIYTTLVQSRSQEYFKFLQCTFRCMLQPIITIDRSHSNTSSQSTCRKNISFLCDFCVYKWIHHKYIHACLHILAYMFTCINSYKAVEDSKNLPLIPRCTDEQIYMGSPIRAVGTRGVSRHKKAAV